jgi:hypothetical protein
LREEFLLDGVDASGCISTGVNFKFDIVFEESDTLVIGVEVIA